MAKQKQPKSVSIERSPDARIVLPEGMTYSNAIEWIIKIRDQEEQQVRLIYEILGDPKDALVALHRAIAELYGMSELKGEGASMFGGATPPTMMPVAISSSESIMVPVSKFSLPGIEGEFRTAPRPNMLLVWTDTRKKYEPKIEALIESARALLRRESIYKGKAIRVSFPEDEDAFNTIEYMDLTNVNPVFSASVESAIRVNLWAPIIHRDECVEHGIPLKRGVLLAGSFGVGKTLCALATAALCVKHGWTFVYLDDASQLTQGIEFARRYAPACLFAEDIDRMVAERSDAVNDILNTLDGIDSKGEEILTVFTTNRLDQITPAMLRPGRLDAVIHVAPPDALAAMRLVRQYGSTMLVPDADLTVVGQKLAGQIPAVIREVVERSKLAALARSGSTKRILTVDLVAAADSMQSQIALLQPPVVDTRSPMERAAATIAEALHGPKPSARRNGAGRVAVEQA